MGPKSGQVGQSTQRIMQNARPNRPATLAEDAPTRCRDDVLTARPTGARPRQRWLAAMQPAKGELPPRERAARRAGGAAPEAGCAGHPGRAGWPTDSERGQSTQEDRAADPPTCRQRRRSRAAASRRAVREGEEKDRGHAGPCAAPPSPRTAPGRAAAALRRAAGAAGGVIGSRSVTGAALLGHPAGRYLRWRILARMRRFLRPTLRRPLPRRRATMALSFGLRPAGCGPTGSTAGS
jgi:hypothetical protein